MIHDFPYLKIGERGACKRCGHVVIRTEHADLTKVYPACGEKPLGLGDRVAVFFAGLGIPECPSCTERKEALNAVGRVIEKKVDDIKQWFHSIIC